MKNEYLIKHLAKVDLSFLKEIKDEVIAEKNKIDVEHFEKTFKIEQPENWNNEIEVLEDYFNKIDLPKENIKLNDSSMITNVSLFVGTHLATVKANNGNKTFLPYLDRLQKLKKIINFI